MEESAQRHPDHQQDLKEQYVLEGSHGRICTWIWQSDLMNEVSDGVNGVKGDHMKSWAASRLPCSRAANVALDINIQSPSADQRLCCRDLLVPLPARPSLHQQSTGMGNQELLEYFHTYMTVKARHSYGPQGHRGISVLIFQATAIGYLEAERLHKQFSKEGRDRDAWEHRRVLFYPGGKRQLYGYLVCKEDMDTFNQHSHGKSLLKFEMKSYQEMVVVPMKQMNEDNQQLVWLKNKVVRQEQHSKVLEETFGVMSQKLRETMEENRIVRLRTKIQHDESREEEKIGKVHKAIDEKEQAYEKLLQDERAKAKQFELNSGTKEDHSVRKEETARFIDNQAKGVEEFEAEREKLINAHEEEKAELRLKHLEEEVELEKKFDAVLTKLMEKYTPSTFQASSST